MNNVLLRMILGLGLLQSSMVLAGGAQPLRIEGASALQPLMQAAGDGFRHEQPGVGIEVTVGGSGGGLMRLCHGNTDIVATTRPMRKDELEACAKAHIEFIELPLALDAVTVVINSGNNFVKSLSVDDLRKIWDISAKGRIQKWNEINSSWPDWPLTLLAPDGQSDEGGYFNAAILGNRPVRTDVMVSGEDDVLIRGVARSSYTLSYVAFGDYWRHHHQLKAVPIAPAEGAAAVTPSPETIADGSYRPLTRPLFLYVAVASLKKPSASDYLAFLLRHAAHYAKALDYVPLQEAAYQRGLERLRQGIKGSVWNGTIPVGLTVVELQKKYGLL